MEFFAIIWKTYFMEKVLFNWFLFFYIDIVFSGKKEKKLFKSFWFSFRNL
jgi:hypothetical protein